MLWCDLPSETSACPQLHFSANTFFTFNSYLLLFSLEIHLKTLRLLTIIRESLFIVRASSHSQEFVSHPLIKKRQGIHR